MEYPGEYLKREREHRDISLSKVYEETRIPLKYLQAIEADDYDKLPHPTFIKGFIRCYGKYLGIDENDAVLRFEMYLKEHKEIAEKDDTPEVWKYHPDSVRKPSINLSGGGKRTIAILAGAGVALIIILYFITGTRSGNKVIIDVEPPKQEAASPSGQVQPSPVQPPVAAQPAQPLPTSSSAAGKASVNAAPADINKMAEAGKQAAAVQDGAAQKEERKHVLVVKARERTWVKVRLDDSEPFDVVLESGQGVTWKARSRISVLVGNAGGADLSFNGQKLSPLGKSGEVVTLVLPSSGAVKR